MTTPAHAPWSARGLRVAGAMVFLALALAGCAAATSSSHEDGGSSPDAGSSDGPSGTGGSHGSGGSSSAGTGGFTGSGGSTAGGSGGASATGGSSGAAGRGGATGGPTCMITLTPLPPASLSAVEVPTANLQIQGVVMNGKVAAPTWKWTVTSPTLTTIMITEQIDKSGPPPSSVVTFPATMEGPYEIRVQNSDASCPQPQPFLITGMASKPSFNLRVTAAGFPVQETRITPSVSSIMVPLDPGGTYPIQPRQAGQITVMPAYLRITRPATTFGVEGYTSHGAVQANLISHFVYDLLVVPDDPQIAPDLFRSVSPELWKQPITFDQGVPVSGLILGPDGAPLTNARMILKLDGRPSTVGTSDASGALTLWTRPGNMSAIVVPPDGSGLPQANVDATSDAGVNLPSAYGSLVLTMRYRPVVTGALTVTVRDPNGAGPVAGARVRLSSPTLLSGIGTLTSRVQGAADVVLAARGSISTEVVSDANGNAKLGSLPTGSYHVVVVPSSSGAGAITALDVTVPPAGLTKTISLVRKVMLTGTLGAPAGSAGPSSVAGTSITALDKTGDVAGSVVSTTADATGAFTLQVDPNRTYQLLIQPLAGRALGRMVVGKVSVYGADTSLSRVTLPPGLTFTGTVSGGASKVGGAFLQVFCVPSATWCPDATVALAESTTNPDGTFSFILPNPAP